MYNILGQINWTTACFGTEIVKIIELDIGTSYDEHAKKNIFLQCADYLLIYYYVYIMIASSIHCHCVSVDEWYMNWVIGCVYFFHTYFILYRIT